MIDSGTVCLYKAQAQQTPSPDRNQQLTRNNERRGPVLVPVVLCLWLVDCYIDKLVMMARNRIIS